MPGEGAGQERIEELERRLARALERIEALERDRASTLPKPEPELTVRPVLIESKRDEMVPSGASQQSPNTWVAPPPRRLPVGLTKPSPEIPKTPPKSASHLEYDLGAKVLPWAGALIVIVGIGFLIGTGIERGWITPWMQFSLAMLLSAAFIGAGYWKRSSREDFGGILIGIGSVGVFLSLVGGNVHHALYSGEVLVGSFFAWSSVNLGYSSFIKSRAFHILGFLGGLTAALMPTIEGNFSVNLALHFAVVIPAFVVAARHRWQGLLAVSWMLSSLTLIPVLSSELEWSVRVGAFSLNALLASLAYARAYRETESDHDALLAFCMPFFAGLTAWGMRPDALGSANLAVTAFIFALAGWFLRSSKPGQMIGLGSAVVGLVMSPAGLPGFIAPTVYGLLALACAAASLQWARRHATVLGGIVLACGVLSYLIAILQNLQVSWVRESALLLLLGLAGAAVAAAAHRIKPGQEQWLFGASALVAMAIGRVSWLIGVEPLAGAIVPEVAGMLGVLSASAIAPIALGRRWTSLAALSWLAIGWSVLVYLSIHDFLTMAAHLIVLAAIALATGFAWHSTKPHAREDSLVSFGSLAFWAIGCRTAWVLSSGTSSVIDPVSAAALATLAYAVILTLRVAKDKSAPHVLACMAVMLAGILHVVRPAPSYFVTMLVVLSGMAAVIFVGRRNVSMFQKEQERQASLVIVGAFAGITGYLACQATAIKLGAASQPAAVAALGAVAVAFSIYQSLQRHTASTLLAGGSIAAAYIAYLHPILSSMPGNGSLSARISAPLQGLALPLAVLLLFAVAAFGANATRLQKLKVPALIIAMALGWGLFVQIGLLSTISLFYPSYWNWIVTGFWTLYGALLLTIGFVRNEQVLRFGSIAIFGAAMTKIFTWDLGQAIDPVLRVVILLGLGLAMISGGYAYIRTRKGREAALDVNP